MVFIRYMFIVLHVHDVLYPFMSVSVNRESATLKFVKQRLPRNLYAVDWTTTDNQETHENSYVRLPDSILSYSCNFFPHYFCKHLLINVVSSYTKLLFFNYPHQHPSMCVIELIWLTTRQTTLWVSNSCSPAAGYIMLRIMLCHTGAILYATLWKSNWRPAWLGFDHICLLLTEGQFDDLHVWYVSCLFFIEQSEPKGDCHIAWYLCLMIGKRDLMWLLEIINLHNFHSVFDKLDAILCITKYVESL